MQGRKLRADFVRRSVERVLPGAAGFVRVREHMRAALTVGGTRNVDRPLCVLGLASQRSVRVRTIVRDVDLARDRDLHRVKGPPMRGAFRAVERRAFRDLFGGRVLVEYEIEAARAARRIDASLPAATQNGGCGSCAGGGSTTMSSKLQKRPWWEKRERVSQARVMTSIASSNRASASAGGDLETGELAVPVALADAEIEPSARYEIERPRLLGQQHRVVPGQHDYRGAEPQRGGAHGKATEQHHRGGDLVPAGEVMFDQEARVEAERLGLDVEVEIVAEPLARFHRKIVVAGLRVTQETKSHGARAPSHLPTPHDVTVSSLPESSRRVSSCR